MKISHNEKLEMLCIKKTGDTSSMWILLENIHIHFMSTNFNDIAIETL